MHIRQKQFDQMVEQYDEFYPALLKMIAALEAVEPGGTLTDKLAISSKKHGKAVVTYTVKPLQLTIERGNTKYVLKVVET